MPMRKLALIGLALGAALLSVEPASAYSILGRPLDTAPWCLRYDIGAGVVKENCRLPNFEACNRERQFWGSTAFCSPNPNFAGYYEERGPSRRHRRHIRH